MFKSLSQELKDIKDTVLSSTDPEAADLVVQIQEHERDKLPLV